MTEGILFAKGDAKPWEESGEAKISEAQRRTLNAACGDLSRQIRWHGHRLTLDDWRHMLAGTMLGWRLVPGIDRGAGNAGFIMLGGSSLNLSKSQAADAITQAFAIGDDPSSQGIDAKPVQWCDVICLLRGITDEERAA